MGLESLLPGDRILGQLVHATSSKIILMPKFNPKSYFQTNMKELLFFIIYTRNLRNTSFQLHYVSFFEKPAKTQNSDLLLNDSGLQTDTSRNTLKYYWMQQEHFQSALESLARSRISVVEP
jgi:hypothetical protein